MKSGGNIMMPQVVQKSGLTSGAKLTPTHPWNLAMPMSGMKGESSDASMSYEHLAQGLCIFFVSDA
jgi:hypothetical protein